MSRELWLEVQERLKQNKRWAKRNCQHEYLLRGMVVCGCGLAMVATTKTWGGYYYRCASNMRYIPGVEKRSCTEKAARGDVLEYHVWKDVYELITNPAKFEARLRESQRQQQDLLKPKRDELERVNKLIARCEEEAGNCAGVEKRTG